MGVVDQEKFRARCRVGGGETPHGSLMFATVSGGEVLGWSQC